MMPTNEHGLEIFDDNGHGRPLGLTRSDPKWMQSLPTYGDTTDLIPESEWVEFEDDIDDIVKIKDQNGYGACNGHAAATAAEYARYVAGMAPVDLSAWYVYAILCGGRDVGSSIGEALKLMSRDGCAPESLVKYGIINPDRLTDAAHNAAPNYKIEIGGLFTRYQELGTAVQRRQGLNLAVCVGGNFNDLDADGIPGLGRGPCNHAVFVGGGMKRARDRSWLVRCRNSWNKNWGENGKCWLPAKYLPTASWFEGYSVRAMVEDTADTTIPPVPIA